MVSDVIVLAGGFGKRLEFVSQGIPKPLMRVGSRIFLDYIIDWLSKFDIKRIVLSLYYKPELFVSYIDKLSRPVEVIPLAEPSPMGTGGAIKFVLQNVNISNPFCVLNGDTYLDFDLQDMHRAFQEEQSVAMMGLTYVPDTGRFGAVLCDGNRVVSYSEKTQVHSGWINNGCYLFDKSVFEEYSGKFSIELDMFPRLVGKKLLSAYKANGEFLDIGVPEDYERFVKRFVR